jgi:hypothetical protein
MITLKEFEKINEAVLAYGNDKLSKYTIQYLPEVFLRKMEGLKLEAVWSFLPEKFKEEKYFLERLPCRKHYNLPNQRTHIDGPPSPIYCCYECKIVNNNKIK